MSTNAPAHNHRPAASLSPSKSLPTMQLAGMLFLYPGFFFYHFGVSIGAFPPFLGGYYGPLTVLLLPLLSLTFACAVQKKFVKINRLDVAFFFLACYCLIWSSIYRFFGVDYQADPNLFQQSASGVLVWITNYIIFRNLAIYKWGFRLLFTSGIGMLLITWLNQGDGTFVARKLADLSTQDVIASYQGFARSAVIVLFILMAWSPRTWLIPAYYLGLALLFLLSARSEFGGFIVAGFAILATRLGATRLLFFASPAIIAGFIFLWDAANSLGESSRVLRLITNWQEDNSLANRLELSALAWRAIQENPLIGHYGSYMLSGNIGNYAHNILSAWAGFGLIGFITFTYLLLSSAKISISSIKTGSRKGEYCLSFALALFCLVLAVTAKFMFFPIFAAGWGAAAGLIEMNKMDKKSNLYWKERKCT